MTDIFEGLNEEQREAVAAIEGPLLIVAGPGTGKTMTLVRRISYLVERGVNPSEILAVTFTNRAAREMRERTDLLLGKTGREVRIGTFHLLGLQIMREAFHHEFRVCGPKEQSDILAGIAGDRKAGQKIGEKIGRVKDLMEKADDELKPLFDAYQSRLCEKGLYDFEDLIRIPIEILDARVSCGGFGTGFQYIMVDEYQDINPAQYRLMRSILNGHENLCAVGDSDQAIYGFRGADMENFLRFETDFPRARRIILSRNYRSSKIIVSASSDLIRHNRRRIDKELGAVKEEGTAIILLTVPDEKAEAKAIVREIEHRMGGTSHFSIDRSLGSGTIWGDGHGFSDFAVIYRINTQAGTLEEAFFDSGMPFQVVRGGGPAGAARMTEILRKRMEEGINCSDLPELVNSLCIEAEASEKDRALLFQIVSAYSDLPADQALLLIMDELSLLSSGDSFDPKADAVSLMTLHSAKGLEFKTVFIAGAEDGLTPSLMAKGEFEKEEERRLFYVGMTRAKDELIFTRAQSRFMYGERRTTCPSPFLGEISQQWLERRDVQKSATRAGKKQMKLF
ncbi:MAG TPA: UvrD-helicase domain-containing protein [Syntrophorhabdaceae bacterium]|jgi:superfamily I DNA/RNA helicase